MITAYEYQFGTLLIECDDGVLTRLASESDKREITTAELQNRNEFTDKVYSQVLEYLEGRRTKFDLPYKLKGSEFQQKVWQALLDIPYGETRTYKDIAEAIGNPKASRAVGMANNKNPLLLIVPCHRVIGANGALTGYAGGLEMKQALLNLEASKVTNK